MRPCSNPAVPAAAGLQRPNAPERPLLGHPAAGLDPPYAAVAGKRLLVFGGCNYLNLSTHPRVLQAAAEAMHRYGLSTGASRTTTGNSEAHTVLEDTLQAFFSTTSHRGATPEAVVLPDGYTANLAAMQALAENHDIACLDERVHQSVVDAARLAGLEIHWYRHLNAEDAGEQATRAAAEGRRVIVATDGVFTGSGSVAPLPELNGSIPESATLLVDDCHGLGTVGPGGRGSCAAFSISRRSLVVTSTLAKGIGCHGGFVLGSGDIAAAVRRASAYVCTTPAAPPLSAAATAAFLVLHDEPDRIQRLQANAQRLQRLVHAEGQQAFPTPVAALRPANARRLEAELRAHGIWAPVIRYPGGPAQEYLRLAVTAAHTPAHLNLLEQALRAAGSLRAERTA